MHQDIKAFRHTKLTKGGFFFRKVYHFFRGNRREKKNRSIEYFWTNNSRKQCITTKGAFTLFILACRVFSCVCGAFSCTTIAWPIVFARTKRMKIKVSLRSMYPAGGFQRAKQNFLNFHCLHVAVGSESFWQELVLTISQEKYISW